MLGNLKGKLETSTCYVNCIVTSFYVCNGMTRHPLYEYTRLDFIEPVFYKVMVNATLLTPTYIMTKYGDTFRNITRYLTPDAGDVYKQGNHPRY